ncbi:MAG TPA: hypothetical protein VGQ59_21590 [Cyclobacteriaceae bacterium]|jgi:hypothetical protein|nr:hypothetical protein [Cyclobacteriaceae bacterium]
MRKLFCISWLLALAVSAHAQNYRKIKVGIGFGSSSNTGFPPLLYLEPAYRINDVWSLGIKVEAGSFQNGYLLTNSYGCNGQYYFLTKNKIRPFIGLGLSLYSIANNGLVNDGGEPHYERNKMGFYPRLGFDYGHLSIVLDYNLMTPFKAENEDILNPGSTTVSYLNGNYLAIKIGIVIGGGKKK